MYVVKNANGFVKYITPILPENGEIFEAFNAITVYNFLPKEVPKMVTNLQLRLAMIQSNKMPSLVDNYINGLANGIQKEQLYALWNYARNFETDNPNVDAIANGVLGLTNAEKNDLLILAGTIV